MVTAFAKALSELPKETVLHCWAPVQPAYDNMAELHAKAARDLPRLFPNMKTYVPEGHEEEPDSDAEDDFEPAPRTEAEQRTHSEHQRVEHARAAEVAIRNGAPERRPMRSAAATANAAMDAMHRRGELV